MTVDVSCQIAIDGVLCTFAAIWISILSDLGYLKKIVFLGSLAMASFLLLADIAINMIVRLQTSFEFISMIAERAILCKIAIILIAFVISTVLVLLIFPEGLLECIIDLCRRLLFECDKSLHRIRNFVREFKKSLRK